tara:strand:- start:1411 stop:3897 length:2487 start_codon:yes stop_codon:yes gene_type:complete
MATTFTENGGGAPNGSKLEFTYTFPILQTEDIEVQLNGHAQATTKYTVDTTSNPTKITFNNTNIDSTVQESTGAPKTGVLVTVARVTIVGKSTGDDDPKAVFAAGSSIRAVDLNANTEQALFAIHELQERKVTTTKILDNSVTSSKILDGTIVDADISSSAAIANTKIANGLLNSNLTVNSDNIVDGSIVNADINASANIAGSKLANDSVTLDKLGPGALPTDITVASANIVNGTIVDSDIATGTLDNRYYTEAELDSGQLDNRYYTETQLDGGSLDTRYYTETELNAGQLDSRYFTETEINNGQLDTRYYTETELDAGQLDNRYFTETEADGRFLRQDSTDVLDTNATWTVGNTHVATTGAIEARIVDLIDDVGGFDAIANETSFPATNPQGTTGQSAILSIAAVSTTLTPSSNTITIANGAGSGNTVTINNVTPSSIPQGFGLLVESTSTLHTYNFHRLVPKALEVNTVATNITNIVAAGANVADINNFADLYQISNNAPTQRVDGTSLQDGDLWFDNSNDNLRVYDGTNWAIISPNQSVLNDIAIVSGAITYQEDLGLISDAVTTGSSNGSLDIVADILEDEATFTVTAATGKFIIDGVDKPALTLYKGWTYTFDISDASNATHPLRFYAGSSQYSTNVTVTGTQGQAGAKISIKIPETQPTNFQYYCTNHSGMGNTITVKDDPLKTIADISASIVAAANNSANINLTAGSIGNVNAVGASIGDVNRYANEYSISATQPSSPSTGDLWFDTTNNILKNYNGTIWAGITSNSGISDVVSDTTPQLGGALDCQNNGLTNVGSMSGVGNMSGVGTVDGTNLQLDFGTL